MSDITNQFLKKVKEFQNRIKNCKDSREAVMLQAELVKFLKENLKKDSLVRDKLIEKMTKR